ncbi:hypothetical protein DASC09_050610 [Saccharomycopsis crataegensis]|uniref:Zn(2)-C6 fungal-type domain-containing protein n=1 Tax=Saccharomycopsis crataegensis TaxID=43959 RepID=A0AAV5QSN0_9ASCO|nr:hypothetical protein DASC09_050610 [Saccharomycopsis crataegensis]
MASKRPLGEFMAVDDSSPQDRSGPGISDFAKKWRQIRACARCHRLKMKCAYDDPSYSSCKRCFSAGVECSPDFDPTSKFKVSRPRKKSKIVNIPDFKQLSLYIGKLQTSNNIIDKNKKVEDQEKLRASIVEEVSGLRNVKLQLSNFISQIDHLVDQKESLLRQSANPTQNNDANVTNSPQNVFKNNNPSSKESMLPPSIITPQNLPIIPFEKNLVLEIIKLNYLSIEVVREKYQYFKDHLLIFWPAIKLPDAYTVDYLIKNKPLLLISLIVNCCATSNDIVLYNILSYYLDMNLSHQIFINGNLSIDIIQSFLVLSIWNPPPKQWGTFKHQLHLLTSLNLNLVVDLGAKCEQILIESSTSNKSEALYFNDNEIVRLYLMIYSSCGSLGLSLPKFKSVVWTSNHHLASTYLYDKYIKNNQFEDNDRTDIFIYYLSRLICIGQDMATKLDTASGDTYNDPESLSALINTFEERLLKLMLDYRLTDPSSTSNENPLVGLTYQQILMTMYDHLIYKNLSSSLIFFINNSFNKPKVENEEYRLYQTSIKVLEKLIIVCKKLVETFLLVSDKTLNVPTFFHYRPMNAIVSLIKAKILIKLLIFELSYRSLRNSSAVKSKSGLINDELIDDITFLDFNLKSFFNHFYKKYESYTKSSMTYEKMFVILKKTKKLIKLVDQILNKKNPHNKQSVVLSSSGDKIKQEDSEELIAGFNFKIHNKSDENETTHQENSFAITSNLANNDLLNLLYELGKEKAVENIDILELNSETKRKKREARRRQKLVNDTDSMASGDTPGVVDDVSIGNNEVDVAANESAQHQVSKSTSEEPQVSNLNFFFKELFSNNLFSDIITEVAHDEMCPDISQLLNSDKNQNSSPDPNMDSEISSQHLEQSQIPQNTSNTVSSPSVHQTGNQNMSGTGNDLSYPVSPENSLDMHESNNLLLYGKGGFSSINQLLAAPSQDIFSMNYGSVANGENHDGRIPSTPMTSMPMVDSNSTGAASSIGDDYSTRDFWTSKDQQHPENINGFDFD